jgi:hypothetical protein
MYYLSVGAVFKNENHIFKEWLDHYIMHGVEHFYLINDNSNDNYVTVLQPYIDKGLITLYHNDIPWYAIGRQKDIYTKYFTQHLKDTFWMAIIDLDEFLYAPKEPMLPRVLAKYEEYGYIVVNWALFGSSGLVKQPASVVEGFTKRGKFAQKIWRKQINNAPVPKFWPVTISETDDRFYYDHLVGPKCILNTQYLISFDVHSASSTKPDTNASYAVNYTDPELLINHYFTQSEEYWKNVKIPRGNVCYCEDTYFDMHIFELWNSECNNVTDTALLEQNKELRQKLETSQ